VTSPSRRPDLLREGIGAVLRFGTLVAIAAVAIGYLLLLDSGDAPGTQPLVELLSDGGGGAVVGIGLLVLTLVPIGVVGVAAAAFWKRGERRELVVTLVVLALLALSLVAGVVLTSG
jgi:uncharacterized membrane protein